MSTRAPPATAAIPRAKSPDEDAMRPLIAVALLLALGATPASSAPPIRIKGRFLARVHLDAGRAEGLKVGDRLRLGAGEAAFAEIEIVYIEEHTAYCKVLSQKRPIGAGDLVVPVVRASSPPTPPARAQGAVATASRSEERR